MSSAASSRKVHIRFDLIVLEQMVWRTATRRMEANEGPKDTYSEYLRAGLHMCRWITKSTHSTSIKSCPFSVFSKPHLATTQR